MICPSCGNNAPDTMKFCGRCGREMPTAKHQDSFSFGMTAMLEPGGGGDSLFDKLFNPRIINTQNPNSPRPIARSLYLTIWISMFIALFAYVVPWYLITSEKAHEGAQSVPEFMIPVISVIAAVLWCAGVLVAVQGLSPKRLKYCKDKEQLRANMAMFGIISMAFLEGTAVFGLALVIMQFNKLIVFPFLAASGIGLLIHLALAMKAWKFHDTIPDN